jgi:restriction system protein
MHINNARQYFLDTLVELTGIKSGLAVLVPKAIDLLDGSTSDSDSFWRGDPAEYIRVEAGVLQSACVRLLHCIGAIGDPKDARLLLMEFVQRNAEKLRPDQDDELKKLAPYFTPEIAAISDLENMIYGHRAEPTPLIRNLLVLPEWKELAQKCALRSISRTNIPESRKWNGTIDLRDLFQSEAAPRDPETYFDQRFIDYLNAQTGELTAINWRQFERLAAEYFNRTGYRVDLGPGRADGGIDLRAAKDRVLAGPEVIIVQCKRIKEGNEVAINDVKALWADVHDEGASKGLIATTARLAKGARDYCDARKYRLNRAEGDTVRQWIREMARHSL